MTGLKTDLEDISNKHKFLAIIELLNQIENEIKGNLTEFKGTDKFLPNNISEIFSNKTLKIQKGSERENGQEEFLEDKDWYIFNANFGTSEEKAFVKLFARQISELQKKYDLIYLVRNERHFKIFNFKDGRAFEPDFVLFLKNKNGEDLTYQLFIEPKGKFLQQADEWKKDFLIEIKEKYKNQILIFNELNKYKIIGVPFYNTEDENEFKGELFDII